MSKNTHLHDKDLIKMDETANERSDENQGTENLNADTTEKNGSENRTDKVTPETISDDQELFLKVLENLKNAVTKPDNHAIALPKAVNGNPSVKGSHADNDTKRVGGTESLNERSELDEPGTTTITVSDKTKSLILQKLAVTNDKEKRRPSISSNLVIDTTADLEISRKTDSQDNSFCSEVGDDASKDRGGIYLGSDLPKSNEIVKVSVMGFDKVTHEVTHKDVVSARTIKKDQQGKTASLTTGSSGQKQTCRLIAPAVPTVQLFTCSFCDYYSENKNYLKQHIDRVHISDRPFKCPYCDYAGKRSHALREHMIVHSDERPHQCKSCNATFRKKGHLTNHIKLHKSKRLVKCPLCKVLVYDTGENGLDAHLKNDHDTERLYGCDLCNHIAANEPDILKHLNEKHKSKISSQKCDKCPFQTANNADFIAHVAAHEMTSAKIQIGNDKNSKSQVVGVATLPAGRHVFGPPNTSITLESKADSAQPAVIKPVWIKCTECGFTGQDSEVIKKHMLEHFYIQYDESDEKSNTSSHLKEISANVPVLSRNVSKVDTVVSSSSSLATQTVKKPVLVPVTNVEQLFPQHAGKIDMKAPILVPVTDATLIKSLQSFPKLVKLPTSTSTPHLPALSDKSNLPMNSDSQTLKSQTILTTQLSSQHISNMISIAGSQQAVASHQVLMPHALPSPSQKAVTTNSLSVASSNQAPPAAVSPLQIYKNPSLKVVPVVSSQHPGLLSIPMSVVSQGIQSISKSVTLASKPELTSGVQQLSNGSIRPITASPQILSQSQQRPVISITQIPVPRMVNTNETPKLPPNIVQLTSPELKNEETQLSTKTPDQQDHSEEEKLVELREKLAAVQRLIEQQDKLIRQVGNSPLVKSDQKETPKPNQKTVFYVTSNEKQNTSKNTANAGFTHDSSAGRFRCTLCGYTCEYQRTIKAHIWKHSGNKDIDYPMFQNGPLSIYEDSQSNQTDEEEPSIESKAEPNESSMLLPKFSSLQYETGKTDLVVPPGKKMPNFIVYEQTKISNVAPALAQLIAARAMVGLKRNDKPGELDHSLAELSEEQKQLLKLNEQVDFMVSEEQLKSFQNNELSYSQEDRSNVDQKNDALSCANVVVETMESVGTSSGFTGMRSQQGSPRITPAPKSPDSGVSELTVSSKTNDGKSVSSGFMSPIPNFDYIADDSQPVDGVRRSKRARKFYDSETGAFQDGVSEAKKLKITPSHEDSAVTLLSLLQKGPNYNPACPPKVNQVRVTNPHNRASSPGNEDSNSAGETEQPVLKPKSGISTSLLEVIEQLRERSKSDFEEEKPLPSIQPKKQQKRRSRKSSLEDNTPATGIDNVEEFVSEGEIKFRCKLCHYTNDSTVLLRQHMRLHKPKQEFECSLCDLIADSSEALQDHMIQHCKVRTYHCKLCDLAFNYKSQLRAHMRMHNDQDILMCDFCDFETRSASALKTHIKNHLTKPPYKCEYCKEEFITSFNLRVHKREGCYTNLDKGGHFKCDECDFTSMGRREMKNHQKGHMGRSAIQPPKKCPYCEHTTMTIEQVQQHISDVHGESKPLKCEMCGFIAVSIRSLKSHMKRHVNDQRFVAQPLEQYKCNLCGYVCHHLPSLKSHMWRHAADQHYSYEFTNDVINAAIDFDGHTDAIDTTETHVDNFRKLIYDKMKSKGLENTRETEEESAVACCWVTFRCCQCGFETINKAELNMHMTYHSDVIKWTLDVPGSVDLKRSKQAQQTLKD